MDTQKNLACPSCRADMANFVFPRNPQGEITLDICFACQGIWFDEFESLQLAPAGILELFRLIHQHRDDIRQPWRDTLSCPRGLEPLLQGFDLSKNGKFTYHRCLQKHGRFTAFSAFLIEKGFVRQLNGAEIAELAKQVQTIRCSGCGAPVDIRREPVCSHCRAPIAILDPQAVDKALENFGQAAGREGKISPAAFAETLIAQEQQKSLFARQRQKFASADTSIELTDLVVGGAELLWKILHH